MAVSDVKSVTDFLDKVIGIEDDVLVYRPRVKSTVGEAVKILNAALTANLGETEKAVLTRLQSVATRLQTIIGS